MDDTDHKLGRSARLRLLEIARASISNKLQRGVVPEFEVDDSRLAAHRGAFVSLHDADEHLRGCIGTLYAERPLHQVVAEMAAEAATADPRFNGLSLRELKVTDIEISVLTPFEPIDPSAVEVGRHGLYIARGPRRGVLLPQVATQYAWDRETFLAQACKKAGLPADAWKAPDTHVLAFEAQVFSDLGEMDAMR